MASQHSHDSDHGHGPERDHDHDHDYGHSHAHGHGHSHAPASFGRAFAVGITLNTIFVLLEAVYGVLSHSLALLADAGHNLSDVLGLALAWGATVLAKKLPSSRFTYGLRSSSILAALANAVFLLVATGGIAWEAILRFRAPSPVVGSTVIWVAALGILINGGTALMFMRGREHDLNIRGAFMHMAADALLTLGVVVTGILILLTGWLWLDPLVSLVISVTIVFGTWGLLRDSINLVLHGVPPGLDMTGVRAYLTALPGVAEVHDLHVWAMSTTESALTVHLVMPGGHPNDAFMVQVARELHERFQIVHPTIQVETGSGHDPCAFAPDHVV